LIPFANSLDKNKHCYANRIDNELNIEIKQIIRRYDETHGEIVNYYRDNVKVSRDNIKTSRRLKEPSGSIAIPSRNVMIPSWDVKIPSRKFKKPFIIFYRINQLS
jgi:hypothetical protein